MYFHMGNSPSCSRDEDDRESGVRMRGDKLSAPSSSGFAGIEIRISVVPLRRVYSDFFEVEGGVFGRNCSRKGDPFGRGGCGRVMCVCFMQSR
jgi:hypothetical protein